MTEKKASKVKRSAHVTPTKGSKPKGNGALKVVKSFKVDKETAEALDTICAQASYTTSQWLREAVLANRTQVVARRKPTPDYKRLLFLANKASNNINQLAYRVNADHLAGKVSEKTYESVLLELHALTRFFKGMLHVDAD